MGLALIPAEFLADLRNSRRSEIAIRLAQERHPPLKILKHLRNGCQGNRIRQQLGKPVLL